MSFVSTMMVFYTCCLILLVYYSQLSIIRHFDNPPLSLPAITTIGKNFRNSVALDSPPRSITHHSRYSPSKNHRRGFSYFCSSRFIASFDYPPLSPSAGTRQTPPDVCLVPMVADNREMTVGILLYRALPMPAALRERPKPGTALNS